MEIKKEFIYSLVLLLFSTIVALLMVELVLRILNIGYGSAPLEPNDVFHHVHPANYRFVVHTPTSEYGGHEIYYDSERLVANPGRYSTNKKYYDCRIAFLGDSFTEAGQVAYKDSFVGLLENNSNCEVKNYGVSSYSPIFYLLQWRKIVLKFKPTLVVTQLYSNDISSDFEYELKAVRDNDNRVVAIPGPKSSWFKSVLREFYLVRFLRKLQLQLQWVVENYNNDENIVSGTIEENPDISKLSANLIATLAEEVKESGSDFVLFAVPSKYRIFNNDIKEYKPQYSDKWKLIAKKNEIKFIDLVDSFKKNSKNGAKPFFETDIHFNERGHYIVASAISKEYPQLFRFIE